MCTALLLVVLAVSAAGIAVSAARTTAVVPSPPAVSLVVTGDDGAGHSQGAHLTCRGTLASATGFLRPRPVTACAAARRLAVFLASRPRLDRLCTQIYGGASRAWVRGRVGSRSADRRFSRRDGCEIADWDLARVLLPRPAAPSST